MSRLPDTPVNSLKTVGHLGCAPLALAPNEVGGQMQSLRQPRLVARVDPDSDDHYVKRKVSQRRELNAYRSVAVAVQYWKLVY